MRRATSTAPSWSPTTQWTSHDGCSPDGASATSGSGVAERERAQWSTNQGTRDTRWGTPEEIANLIVFAVSDAASYINGAELVADNAMDKS